MSQLMHKLTQILSITEKTLKTNVVFNGNVLQIRYRKAIYPRKYVEPDYVRKEMLAVCEPFFPRDKRQESEKCYLLTPKPDREIHPYDRLLAEDMKRELSSSRMICFFHLNVMTKREKTFCHNLFRHEDMVLRYYNKDIAKLAMTATKWESALNLCPLYDLTVLFSAEPNVSTLLKVTKKCPQLILMAGIIDHRFMSIDDIKQYNRFPDLKSMQSQLSYTLSMANKSIADKTFDPILRLSRSLDSYIKDNKK